MIAPDAPLPWVAESAVFCAGDRKALQVWGDQLVAAAHAALERDGASPEMLADRGHVAWVAIDALIASLGLDRLDTSTLTARVMLKAALAMATETASPDGAILSPNRAAKALAGLQLTANHGLRLALERGQTVGARH